MSYVVVTKDTNSLVHVGPKKKGFEEDKAKKVAESKNEQAEDLGIETRYVAREAKEGEIK